MEDLKALQERINKIAIIECSDYPNVKDENAFSQLWAIERTMQGIKQTNKEVHALWEKSKAENTELKKDLAKANKILTDRVVNHAEDLLTRSEGE